MHQRILYTNAKGELSVVIPCDAAMEALMADKQEWKKVQEFVDKWEISLDKKGDPILDGDGEFVHITVSSPVMVNRIVTVPGMSKVDALETIRALSIPVKTKAEAMVRGVPVPAGSLVCLRDAKEFKLKHEHILFEIANVSDIPTDRTFRNALRHDTTTGPNKTRTDMDHAVRIAHDKRRQQRARLLAPLDIEAFDPAEYDKVEAQRQIIRVDSAAMQIKIDDIGKSNPTEAKLKTALGI